MHNKSIKISAVGSVYKNCKSSWLNASLESLINQTEKLFEIILVIDGPITDSHEIVIESFKNHIVILRNNKNIGLAKSLNKAIEISKGNFIMRYDTDDINSLERVHVMSKLIYQNPEIDIFGTWVKEFGSSERIKKVPLDNSQIYSFLNFRVAMNHPTVFFKKNIWQKLDGYPENIFPEDYIFWLMAKKKGMKFINISELTVFMRTDENFYKRRNGISYIKEEIKYLKYSYENKLLSFKHILFQLLFKTTLRLLPIEVYKILINFVRKFK